jgi:hypothetical protein
MSRAHQSLWTEVSHPGEGCGLGSANGVDNLGPNRFHPFSASSSAKPCGMRIKGDRRFNRSTTTMGSASLVPVEKIGPDFHRLAVPARWKSPIRSIPKHGSGVIRSTGCQVVRLLRPISTTCTGLEVLSRLRLLPGGDCTKGLISPQGTQRPDEVIVAMWQSAGPASDTLPRFILVSRTGSSRHQANLSTQEAVPAPRARIPAPHERPRGRQGGAEPPSQGPSSAEQLSSPLRA